MATIRVKRGTTAPTTSILSYVGELAYDYSNNVLYARNATQVMKIGGELELVQSYEAQSSFYNFSHAFHPDYIYKFHIIATTQGTNIDTSATLFYYRNVVLSNLLGSYVSTYVNDSLTTLTRTSARNTVSFVIPDVHSSGVSLTSGITKVIDFELSATFASGFSDTQQWVAYGKSVTSTSGQANSTITMADFSHTVYGALAAMSINPGLDMGHPDLISVTIYRTRRK